MVLNSFFIKNGHIKLCMIILKIIIKKRILFYENNKHLYKKNLEQLINWYHHFYVYIKIKYFIHHFQIN